jgi:hypothetical protein
LTNAGCYACECACDDYCLPDTLTLIFVASGLCTCLDGEEITLTRVDHSIPCAWEGSRELCNALGEGPDEEYSFHLEHLGGCGVGDQWRLCIETNSAVDTGWFGGSCSATFSNGEFVGVCSCLPLELNFGPFQAEVSSDPPTYCYYDLQVVE